MIKNRILITLSTGCILSFSSFLLYALEFDLYAFLLLAGVFIVFLSIVLCLFSKRSLKFKSVFIAIAFILCSVIKFSAPYLIKKSFSIYLQINSKELEVVNKIILDKKGDINIYNKGITDRDSLLSHEEKNLLLNLRKELGVYTIMKSKDRIYYGIWGFLGSRVALIYRTDEVEEPEKSHKLIKGNWYKN